MSTSTVPEGFEPLVEVNGYIAHNGPYYVKKLPDGALIFGFQADDRHTNPNNVLHGGALSGFADTVFGYSIVHGLGRNCATISLTTEFMAGVPWGSWIEASVHVKRTTKSMAFVDTNLTLDGDIVLSATGVFRLFEPR